MLRIYFANKAAFISFRWVRGGVRHINTLNELSESHRKLLACTYLEHMQSIAVALSGVLSMKGYS